MEIGWILPSRFINEIPDESVKNEISFKENDNFDFNEVNSIESMKNLEVLVGVGIKNKYLNGKNRQISF